MQFTWNIIVVLLLAVSTSTVTAAQKFANLRGGAPSQVSTKPSLTTSSTPSEVLSASPTVAPDVSSKPTFGESEAASASPSSTTAVPSVFPSCGDFYLVIHVQILGRSYRIGCVPRNVVWGTRGSFRRS